MNVEPDHLSILETSEDPTNIQDNLLDSHLFSIRVTDEHFVEIIHFVTTRMAPSEYTTQQKKELVVKATDVSSIVGKLYNMGPYEILHRYVLEHEISITLEKYHGGIAGGHYAGKDNVQNIFKTVFWWPTLHNYAKEYYIECDVCQRTGRTSIRDEMSLVPQVTL